MGEEAHANSLMADLTHWLCLLAFTSAALIFLLCICQNKIEPSVAKTGFANHQAILSSPPIYPTKLQKGASAASTPRTYGSSFAPRSRPTLLEDNPASTMVAISSSYHESETRTKLPVEKAQASSESDGVAALSDRDPGPARIEQFSRSLEEASRDTGPATKKEPSLPGNGLKASLRSFKGPRASNEGTTVKSIFFPIINKVARRHQIDPALVKAVIKAESGYNPRAVSKRGAVGLMQLMPKTAKALGIVNSFDPIHNINGGVKYLRQLLDQFDGDIKLALSAYNAGSRRVREHEGIPPFGETKQYIKKVLEYYKDYKDKLSEETERIQTPHAPHWF